MDYRCERHVFCCSHLVRCTGMLVHVSEGLEKEKKNRYINRV